MEQNTELDSFKKSLSKEDKEKYDTWLRNAEKFYLPNVQEDLELLMKKSLTVTDIVNKQEKTITDMCDDYKKFGLDVPLTMRGSSDGTVQGVQDSPGSSTLTRDQTRQCVEGDQDCELREKYLRVCRHFVFKDNRNCSDNLSISTQDAEIQLQKFKQRLDDLCDHAKSMSTTSGNQKLTSYEKLKSAVRDYGCGIIVFHISLSLTSLGICYIAIKYGIDLPAAFQKCGVLSQSDYQSIAAGASTFVVAYAVHKLLAPARIAVTLTCGTYIVRKLRTIGFLKKK